MMILYQKLVKTMNLNNFNNSISVLPNNSGVFLLRERQNDMRQKIYFDSFDRCVLDVEKMQDHWFNDRPSLCDFIVLYRKNYRLYCILVELKSEREKKSKAIKQLQGGKKLAQYVADICQCQIHRFKGCVFYERGKMRNRPVKKDKLMEWYTTEPVKIDYKNKIGQEM